MIITEQKTLDEIRKFLEPYKKIAIIGCGRCSTSCETGGEKEVAEMKQKLEKEGKKIVDTKVIEAPCDERLTKLELNKMKISDADAILVMSCGGGVSAVTELSELPVFPALNSLFLGVVRRHGLFVERCSMCGDCVLDQTLGICPVTRCSKGLLNGPCGGSKDGKCEVDSEKDCGWVLIYENLKKHNRLDVFKKYWKPKNYKLAQKPRTIDKTKK